MAMMAHMSRWLVQLLLAGVLLARPVLAAEQGLVAHYTFDEGQGAVGVDHSGNDHHGEITGATFVPSPRGHALRFDGVDDLISYGSDESLIVEGDLSLLVWVKTDASVASDTHRLIIGDSANTVNRNLNLRIDYRNQLRFEWGDGAGGYDALLTEAEFLDGTWRHLTVVCETATGLITLYLDALPFAQKQMAVPISRTAFELRSSGAWGQWGAFKGEIDDIRVYDTALPEGEIERLYLSGGGTPRATTAEAGGQPISFSEPAPAAGGFPGEAEQPLQCGPPRMVLDPSTADPTGVLSIPIVNATGAPVTLRLAVYGGALAAYALTGSGSLSLPPRSRTEASLGDRPLVPVFSGRTDLYLTRATPTGQSVVLSAPGLEHFRSRVMPAPKALSCEPLQIEVEDLLRADLAPQKTRRISCAIRADIRAHERERGTLVVSLVSRETGEAVATRTIEGPEEQTELSFDARDLPWGAYDLRCLWRDAGGAERARSSALATILPGRPHHVQVLSNLVSELMNARERGLLGERQVPFMNPRDGWCYFQVEGATALTLGAEQSPLVISRPGEPPAEVMRDLPAGRHVLTLTGRPTALIVRAIPAMIYNVHQATTRIPSFGPHTWERVMASILPQCNIIEGGTGYPEQMQQWRAMGRYWVTWIQTPGLSDSSTDVTLEQADAAWQSVGGYSHPLTHGIQADEFVSSYSAESYYAFTRSMGHLADDPAFAGRLFIPFVTTIERFPHGRLFVRTVIAAGWPFSIERYVPEAPTESEATALIRQGLVTRSQSWADAVPGCLRRAIVTIMYSALPYCTTNTCPAADFKVHLDLQMQLLATDPLFFGLYGVQPYRSNYADPETLRWMGRLLRHYCIEGRTERASQDPYQLRHVLDPDFEQGAAQWQLRPAAEGSIAPRSFSGFGALQGRYPPSARGDTMLVLTRSEKAPNLVGQQVRHLQPGRAYTVKMITADYQDLLSGRSRQADSVLTVKVDGADMLEGGFQDSYPNVRGPRQFGADNRFWMNYHWHAFRARATEARLAITDWQDQATPGAPIGQQTAINFIEVQPYFEPPPASQADAAHAP